MNRLVGCRAARKPHGVHDQRGLTVIEILVATALMGIVAGAISILMGASVQSKMISSGWSSDTQSARKTLAWMSDRVRQAGFNVKPSLQTQLRCKDRIVAQDATLYPTANAVYFSGEILKTDTVAGDQVATFGYYLGTDATTGNAVVMEYNQPCSTGATSVAAYSTELSNPKSKVTNLTFAYYDGSGNAVTNLTSIATIRTITIVSVSLTVQTTEGKYGKQTEVYLNRFVRLWDLEPNANNWLDINETY